MYIKVAGQFIIIAIFTLLVSSCSNPEKDYEQVQVLQKNMEQSIAGSADNATNVRSCQNVIDALQYYIKDHSEGQWNVTAKTALQSWQGKKDSIQDLINSKSDFDEIQKLQAAAEDVMQHSSDYAVQMKSCDNMINSLQQFLGKHLQGEWNSSAQTALMSWKSRKANLVLHFNYLLDKLSKLMSQRATVEAKKVHRMSNIEKMQIASSETTSVGGNIIVTSTYSIRMRGLIVGKNIFKLGVTVTGGIVPESKQVFVSDSVKVVE